MCSETTLKGHHELSLALQIILNSSNSLYKAFIYEVYVLSLKSNVEVIQNMVIKSI